MTTTAQASRLSGELASQLVTRAPIWIMGLFIVLFGIRAARLVADLAGAPTAANHPTQLAPLPAARKVVGLPTILRANLFGQSASTTGVNAPVTTMNLKLVLVFAASDETLGLAALGPSLTDIKVYKVGDTVPGGARLHAVYVDRVLLDRGGNIEALLLPPRAGQSVAAAAPPAAIVNPSASVARVQQAMHDNPALINQVMQRQPVFADGHLRGMRVNPGSNRQAFERLGLKPGDLVTAINGTPLDDQARATEVFNSLSSAAEARVTVIRNDREQELNLNLAQMADEAERLADAPPPDTEPPPPGPDSAR